MILHSFLPVADSDAEALLLGSMPGRASLAAGQYYAHSRNHFWPIIGELFGIAPDIPYTERLDILRFNRIALWDVLASCTRKSSLDAHIAKESEIVNDFELFFAEHPHITDVFFNGRKAEQIFLKRIKPLLKARELACHLLPSTSPAYAAISYRSKLEAWSMLARRIGRQVSIGDWRFMGD
ncbi:MAG: DNA-deoxyinosine glycosylase [Syntrophales bacterium]